jgi:signal transduction histidine kinase
VPATGSALKRISGRPSRQSRFLLWLGFGGLLLLMGVLGLSAISFLYQIEIRQEKLRRDFVESDRRLERLRSAIFVSGTYVRDFLLDTDESAASKHRSQFLQARRDIEFGFEDYKRVLTPDEQKPFQQLGAELTIYFDTLMPALEWTPEERHTKGLELIREEVLPRRMNAVSLADQIQQISERQLEASSQQVGELFTSFRTNLIILLILTVGIGISLAAVTMWRLFRLEDDSAARFNEVMRARQELQQLSAELVSAQEIERRRISRELHDEVGQVLSALMLTLGNLGSSIKANNKDEGLRQLDLAQNMTEENARVVRNLSLLLRPTMLDDLGLLSALKWLAREVTRNSTLQVDVAADASSDTLPEEHRTCVYRVVQEAIRNVSRHAAARHARVYLKREQRCLRVSVQDDGKGFDAGETGIGILGMQERVARLGGSLKVESERGQGTIISFELPLPQDLDSDKSVASEPPHDTSPLRTA